MDWFIQLVQLVLPHPYDTYCFDALFVFLAATTIASYYDAWIPQPPAGCWPIVIKARAFVSWLAVNRGWAANAIPAGFVSPVLAKDAAAAEQIASEAAVGASVSQVAADAGKAVQP